MAYRIARLALEHQRRHFDCGDPALDSFLRQHAGQQQRKGFSKTYVALAEDGLTVHGFITLSAGQVSTVDLPGGAKLPRHPAPVLRIGRLAVDRTRQGRGIGQDLLAHALRIALEFAEKVGLYAVLVDAKNQGAADFYRRLGFIPLPEHPLCLFLPIGTLAKTGS